MKRFIMIIVSIVVFCMGMDSFAKTSSHDERLNLIHRKFGDDFIVGHHDSASGVQEWLPLPVWEGNYKFNVSTDIRHVQKSKNFKDVWVKLGSPTLNREKSISDGRTYYYSLNRLSAYTVLWKLRITSGKEFAFLQWKAFNSASECTVDIQVVNPSYYPIENDSLQRALWDLYYEGFLEEKYSYGGKENSTKYIWGYTYWYMPYPVDKFKAYQKERRITLAQMRAKRHKITDF